jgi:hypothetical protein
MTSSAIVRPAMPDRRDIAAAIERFEHESGLDSPEFVRRYLNGEFGRVAWARVWFDLLR